MQRLLAEGREGGSWNDDDPRLHDLLDRAWGLMGEWAAASVARTPTPTTDQLTAAMEELNLRGSARAPAALDDPDEFFRRLESYRLAARAFPLEAGAYAIAISYGYTGRLLVVSPRGVHASAAIDRGGVFFPLPRTPSGHDRFAIDANPNDWPTSSCGGGQLTVWEWDGDRLAPLVDRSYAYPRGDRQAWGVHRRGRWIKIYTRGELELLGDCCACTEHKAVRKLRIGPDRIDEFAIEYFVPECPVVDDLLNRAIRGMDASDIAAPEAARDVAQVLQLLGVTLPDPSLGMVDSGRTKRDANGTEFTLTSDDAEFVFRMVHRDGRLFITDMLRPRPRAVAFLAAVRAKLEALGKSPWDSATLPSAVQQVSRERPDLVPDEEDVEHVIRCGALRPCGR